MPGRLESSSRWVIVAAALVAAAGSFLLYWDYQAEISKHRLVVLARGHTVLDALAAGIRAQGRMGRYRPERLTAIFDELAETHDIVGLELRANEGQVVASAGHIPSAALMQADGTLWHNDMLIVSGEPLLLSHGPGDTMGRGLGRGPMREGRGQGRASEDTEGWEPFPPGPYMLVAVLDATSMRIDSLQERIRFLISSGILVIAVVLGTWAMIARTRQRQLQTALRLAQERTEQQERLAQIGAGLAHETKNPLGIVRGLAQMIADAPDIPTTYTDNRKSAADIVDEVDRTIGQINSFLTVSRPSIPELVTVPLDDFIPALLSLVEADARRNDIRLISETSGLRIRADDELLRRALLNLLINAFRACKAGAEVQVVALRSTESVTLSISDTGCGIAPEDISRVTEPYFGRFEGGSGLGLAIVRQIVEAHGWQLRIESELGVGTRVSLTGIKEAADRGA